MAKQKQYTFRGAEGRSVTVSAISEEDARDRAMRELRGGRAPAIQPFGPTGKYQGRGLALQ